jgi:hypothetical protein
MLHQPPEQIGKRGLGKDGLGVLDVESLMLLQGRVYLGLGVAIWAYT